MLEDLAARLGMMTQGSAPDGKTIPKVIHLAAQAALVVLRKYETLGRECEVYEIAMGKHQLRLLLLKRQLIPFPG